MVDLRLAGIALGRSWGAGQDNEDSRQDVGKECGPHQQSVAAGNVIDNGSQALAKSQPARFERPQRTAYGTVICPPEVLGDHHGNQDAGRAAGQAPNDSEDVGGKQRVYLEQEEHRNRGRDHGG